MKRWTKVFGFVVLTCFVSHFAWAQSYPTKNVRIVVGFPPGTFTDIFARLIRQSLTERLGQPFIIENRPGAGSNIGTDVVAHATPDGYTLLLVAASNTINTTLYDKLNFDFTRDISPIAAIASAPLILVVNPSFPAKTVAELIAHAKTNPGKVTMASVGNGSGPHVAGELFKMMAAVDLVHVPYRVAPFNDLIGGHVQLMFTTMPSSIEFVRSGKLRALAVTTSKRSDALPDLPTVSEFLPGYEASAWVGLGAPRNTPAEIIGRLNREINAALADPKMKARIAGFGSTVMTGSPEDFRKLFREETEKWGKVVKFARIKPD